MLSSLDLHAARSATHVSTTAKSSRSRGQLVIVNVLATQTPAPPAQTPTDGPGIWSAIAGQLGGLRMWPTPSTMGEAQQVQQAIQDVSKKDEQGVVSNAPLPDINKFLTPVSLLDLRHLRKLSSLTGLTYKMGQLTPRRLWQLHRLELVTSSLACELCVYEHPKTADECADCGDGMTISLQDALEVYDRSGSAAPSSPGATAAGRTSPPPGATAPQSNIVALPLGLKLASAGARPPSPRKWVSPAEIVAAKLSEAAAAASAASAAAVQPLASAAESLMHTGPLTFMTSARKAASPPGATAAPATATQLLASSAIAGIAAAEVSGGPSNPPEVKAASTSTPTCPSEWFVADDAQACVRYFVIQGSDSLDHWKTNLTFDPVVFEDEALGVKVHRGAYEAALGVYDRFLPLVQEYLEQGPAFNRVCFTGHSVGGSIALVLTLMFKHRGIVSATQIEPCTTFGSPSIFSEASTPVDAAVPCSEQLSSGCGVSAAAAVSTPATPAAADASPSAVVLSPCRGGLLRQLGLPESAVRNVLMARDIVPRAFSCDYTMVADLLRNWGPIFREHHYLTAEGRKHMYCFVGQMMVMQPSRQQTFASREPPHPMLPSEPELYALSEPTLASTMRATAKRATSFHEGAALGPEVQTVAEAVAQLMDRPHPLETFGDPGAYGGDGSISRYHNPDNYTRAIGAIVHHRRCARSQERPDGLEAAAATAAALRRRSSSTIDGSGVIGSVGHSSTAAELARAAA